MAKEITEGVLPDDENPKRDWVRNSRGPIPEIYSNYIHSSWSLFDARILFGHLKPELGSASRFIVEEQCAVTLEWHQVRALAGTLANMVRAYEHVNGEIKPLKLAPRYEDITENES